MRQQRTWGIVYQSKGSMNGNEGRHSSSESDSENDSEKNDSENNSENGIPKFIISKKEISSRLRSSRRVLEI